MINNKLFLSLLIFISSVGQILAADSIPSWFPQLVKIHSESDLDSLYEQGVEVLRRRGDILLCFFPNTQTRSSGAAMCPRPIVPALDIAKSHFDAGSIQNGTGFGRSFTGKGVVVGICDIGIDPLHPTFLDADGHSRIKRVVQYIENKGLRVQLDGDDDYRGWVTDNPEEYHATHVCGILAGNGAATQYSGIASDAEIVVTVSTLTEVGLLAGVEDIIEYAKEVGKPAVINISVGSYTGPHDGSSLFSQYLDMCAEDAIIVLSSGNEGFHYNSLVSSFSPERTSVAVRLGNKAWNQFKMYGATEIWSGSDIPLKISLGFYDTNERMIVGWKEQFSLAGGDTLSYSWDGTSTIDDGFPYEGEMMITGDVDSENGRHFTVLSYDFFAGEKSTQGDWARYELAVKVEGQPGNDVEIYSDGIYTRLSGVQGSVGPSTNRSVSDLACGFRVISVGMYGNRDSIPVSCSVDSSAEDISWIPTGYETDGTVRYSSYGRLRDNRQLPITVAPGATLMSSVSRPYLELYPDTPHFHLGEVPWIDCGGTSMSSPYVAGYIATWLEAVPTLTVEDIMQIIEKTNRHDIPDPDDPRNASGYFDPVRSLRLALLDGGVEAKGRPEELLLPEDLVEVYDLTGAKIYAGAAVGLSGIENGLYVVKTPYGVMKSSLPRYY